MTVQILMPALSPTMTEGKLAKWVKKEGDKVESGDIIAEIETDKATMEFESIEDGTMGKILVQEGTEGVAVNSLIAILLEDGEDASALDGADASSSAAPVAAPAVVETAPAGATASAAAPAPAAPAAKDGSRIFSSPLARRLAAQEGLDLSQISGSGPRGRIVKRDIETALAQGTGKAAPAAATAPVAVAQKAPAAIPDFGMPYREEPNSSMRKVIAKRLSEAKRDIPHFYLSVDCQLDALLDMRKQLNGRSPEGAGAFKVSVNDFIIKAVGLALKQVPAANATWTDEAIRLYDDVDVSVAVATPAGLITPIIRKADQKGLASISNEMKTLAAKAKDGKLMPEEFQGGGFTISNLGMFGVKDFSAIINPPQSCILAVGAGEQRPVVKDGALAIATVMTVTLSVDHRSVDGAVGAQFLQAFKKIVEDPISMML